MCTRKKIKPTWKSTASTNSTNRLSHLPDSNTFTVVERKEENGKSPLGHIFFQLPFYPFFLLIWVINFYFTLFSLVFNFSYFSLSNFYIFTETEKKFPTKLLGCFCLKLAGFKFFLLCYFNLVWFCRASVVFLYITFSYKLLLMLLYLIKYAH